MLRQAAFARLCGVSPQMVSKYKQDGRLVYIADKVDVAGSLARLAGTLDEEKRRAALAAMTRHGLGPGAGRPSHTYPESELSDKQRREKIAADKAEIELMTMMGRLVDAAEVRRAVEDACAQFWSEIGRRERDDADGLAATLRLDAAQSRTLRAELHKRDMQFRRDFAGALAKLAQEATPMLRVVTAA